MNLTAKAILRSITMNRTEAAWDRELSIRHFAGEILRWDFQPEKLRLADNTFYTPDFRAVLRDHTIVFYEVKGFWRDDARVKIKVAAEYHPYRFIAVQLKKKQWIEEEI